MGEANVPTKQSAAGQEARVPAPDVDPRRSGRPEVAAGQGSPAPLGLIWRLSGRQSFGRIRAEGSRFSHGELWMIWVADAAANPPRIGYAVGRALGTAVDRNRVRRRLRALMADAARAGRIPGGLYLVGTRSGAVSSPSANLAVDLDRLLTMIEHRASR
jgi:ribonuclease P protein component